MRAVVVSDVHVDAVTAGKERFSEIESRLQETVDFAIENEVDAWIFTGDWCNPDNKRTIRAIKLLNKLCDQLLSCGVPPVLLDGNHDTVEDGFETTVLSPAFVTAMVVEKPTMKIIGDSNCMFLPFPSRSNEYHPDEYVQTMFDAGQEVDFIFGHLNIEQAVPGSETTEFARGKEHFWPLESISKCFPKATLIGGHYHRRQVIEAYGVKVQIVGSLCQLAFDEEKNEPGYLTINVDPKPLHNYVSTV